MEQPNLIDLPNDNYIPGVCNIGPLEIQRRKNFFYLAVFGSFVIASMFWVSEFNLLLTIFSYLVLLGTGFGLGLVFFEWYDKFCVAFGFFGYFNFQKLGNYSNVENKDFTNIDRRKVLNILLKSLFVSVVYTLLVASIALIFDFPKFLIL